MKVRVEGCYAGGKFYYRVTVPHSVPGRHAGRRFRVYGDKWRREQAQEALAELERAGVKRSLVRFEHE